MIRKTRQQLDREIMQWIAEQDLKTPSKYDPRSDDRTRDGKIVLGDVVSYRDRSGHVVSGVVKKIAARDGALWEGNKADALVVQQYRDPTHRGDAGITAILSQTSILAVNGRRQRQ